MTARKVDHCPRCRLRPRGHLDSETMVYTQVTCRMCDACMFLDAIESGVPFVECTGRHGSHAVLYVDRPEVETCDDAYWYAVENEEQVEAMGLTIGWRQGDEVCA